MTPSFIHVFIFRYWETFKLRTRRPSKDTTPVTRLLSGNRGRQQDTVWAAVGY